MPREYRLYLKDILQAATDSHEFTRDLTLEQFREDRLRLAAVLHSLTVIGEAVKNVPEKLRESAFGADWKRIAGLRDFIVHVYFGINVDIIWNIVTVNVPELVTAVQKLLADEARNGTADPQTDGK